MFEEAVVPVLYPLLAVLIWAANTIVSKAAAGVVDPAAISFYRWLLAAIVLTPFCARPLWRPRQVRDAPLVGSV